MTEIEKKALALMNEVARERGSTHDSELLDRGFVEGEALCRAIERHEAFKQEVSDALLDYFNGHVVHVLKRFIIAKPDPLVDLCYSMGLKVTGHELRAAIEKRGGKIVWEAGNDR